MRRAVISVFFGLVIAVLICLAMRRSPTAPSLPIPSSSGGSEQLTGALAHVTEACESLGFVRPKL